MKDIEVNGAHITDESAEILKQWQTKTEPVSACYTRIIEETIDYLTDEGALPLPAEKIVERIRTLRMMKRDIEALSSVQ
jgi:hypothetical protein